MGGYHINNEKDQQGEGKHASVIENIWIISNIYTDVEGRFS